MIIKKEFTLTSKEVKTIICEYLREKGFSVIEDNIKFIIKDDEKEYYIKECTIEADIPYL